MRIARVQRLPGWSWGLDEERWEHAFGLLQQYAAREGNAQVPSAHEEDGFKLGRWVVNQRQHYAKGEVRSDRVARLEAVGDWSWNTREDLWEERFVRLRRFVDRTGHARVPKGHVEDGVQLGAWVDDQREARSAGKLDNERAARLESLDGWSWKLREDRWESMLVALQRYVTREGHASPPKGHIEGGGDLGAWVRNQRVAYAAGKLSSERVVRLAAVPGWTWSQHQDQWEQAFTILQRFVQDQGHALVPSKHRENGLALGQWVANQRQQSAKGKLSDERARRLLAVPGWTWNTRRKNGRK